MDNPRDVHGTPGPYEDAVMNTQIYEENDLDHFKGIDFKVYVLYPYRASAPKNQVRWQFGVLVPPAVAAADPSERPCVRTECLVEPGLRPRLTVRVRCLQVRRRSVEAARAVRTAPAVDGALAILLADTGATTRKESSA